MAPTTAVVNLAKNIVGSGVLALAAGVAAYSGAGIAVLPALGIMLALCGLSCYSFSVIGRVGADAGAATYKETWASVFGTSTSALPAAIVTFKTLVGAVAYAIIIGDSFGSINRLAGLPAALCNSNLLIGAFGVFVFLPLCLMRDLSSLAVGSILGTAGTIYTSLFMLLRLVDGSYGAGGKYHEAIEKVARPLFVARAAGEPLLNAKAFVLVSMMATAFLAHYNAPKFFKELAPPTDGSSKAQQFNLVSAGAFGLAALLCGSIMTWGFLTFGAASQGLILNNYATSDPLAFIARLGIGCSIIFSYPINFIGLREGVLGLLGATGESDTTHVVSTVLLLAVACGISMMTKNLGLVVALGGAVLGSALVYVIPAAMGVASKLQKGKKTPLTTGEKAEVVACGAMGVTGVALGVLGAIMSLKGAAH
jgi:sodium-coupled neutral amino acid transporter 11